MRFAEYWTMGTHGKLVPALGSDSVRIIDGRFGPARQHHYARNAPYMIPGKHLAYVIRQGRSFSDSRPLMSAPAWIELGRVMQPDDWDSSFLN